MGPFETQVELALLERKSDARFLRKARWSFRAIADVFDRLADSGQFWDYFNEPKPGLFGVDLRNWSRIYQYFPGILAFRSNSGPVIKHGIGHTKSGRVAIQFTHYSKSKNEFSEWFPENFHKWWRYGLEDIWRHEYTHWLDSERNDVMRQGIKGTLKNRGSASRQTAKEYYNHPTELQAYYIEALGYLSAQVRDIIRDYEGPNPWKSVAQAIGAIGRTPREFIGKFKAYADKDWWGHLTPENERRIIKRIVSSWRDLKRQLDHHIPRGWERWSTDDIIAAANASED